MYRAAMFLCVLALSPSAAMAQQPCTTDVRQVVDQLYRHLLERQADTASADWAQELESGRMDVRGVVRAVAKSPEYIRRFFYTETGEGTPHERSVARLYRHILGRQPDAEGQRLHAELAQRRGADAVIDRIVDSSEYDRQFGAWGIPGSGGIRYCAPANWGASQETVDPLDQQRFEDLDANTNGRLEPREWHDTVAAVNWLDQNNDNVLSRDEMAEPGVNDTSAEATSERWIRVTGIERWTDTGINVRAGDTLNFHARGTVYLSGNGNDIAGVGGAVSGRRASGAPLSRETAGALIAQVGDSDAFVVGHRRSVRAPASGRLYLGVNDDRLADNWGDFEVTVAARTR